MESLLLEVRYGEAWDAANEATDLFLLVIDRCDPIGNDGTYMGPGCGVWAFASDRMHRDNNAWEAAMQETPPFPY